MNNIRTTKFDVADHLRTAEEMAAYLEACLDEPDAEGLVRRGHRRVRKRYVFGP